jgi:hypothetical protein
MKSNISLNRTSLGKRYFWLRENLPKPNMELEKHYVNLKILFGWNPDSEVEIIICQYGTGVTEALVYVPGSNGRYNWRNIKEFSEEEIQEIIKRLWEICG